VYGYVTLSVAFEDKRKTHSCWQSRPHATVGVKSRAHCRDVWLRDIFERADANGDMQLNLVLHALLPLILCVCFFPCCIAHFLIVPSSHTHTTSLGH
jgi:hypothetical protein